MSAPVANLNSEILSNFDVAVQKEWLLTNGLGGYASSTALGINTRKYHGLLVAAIHPPRDRRVCLEKLDEEVIIGNDVYQLGANEFQGKIFPLGYTFLRQVIISSFAKYLYALQNVEIEKTVFLPYGKNISITLYNALNRTSFDIRARVFPLINCRHFHSTTDRRNLMAEPHQNSGSMETCIMFGSSAPTLIIASIGGKYSANEKWLERVYYREEAKRGESCLDDCYQSGFFEFEVKANRNENFAIIAVADEDSDEARRVFSSMPQKLDDMAALFKKEKERAEKISSRFYELNPTVQQTGWLNFITQAADMFVVSGMDLEHRSVIAGYHWFEDWGRDAFVSLPGLTLATGRFEDARKILLTFQKYFKDGLIPNFIPDKGGQAAYNTADATLWYVNSIFQYLKYTEDFEFVQTRLLDTLKGIVESLLNGAASDMHVDADGLILHGPQLTWMDAVADGQPVTPRAGKAVEIQALWYNTLKIVELISKKLEATSEAEKYAQMAEKARMSFVNKFWNAKRGCLFDLITGDFSDDSLRPNQIFAVALDFTMFDNISNEKIVDSVYHELATPYGLRSLAKTDPRYVGSCSGDRNSRDRAYHNGTIWPWLLGPFTTAFLKVKGYDGLRRDYALRTFLEPFFRRHINDLQAGTANEIFDGDPPHMARGCILQAWSVAEPLRAYLEGIMYVRPKYERVILGSN
ncbi:MAG TPA: amylo-alpha-1,6-glucosidase [Candidatus Acidoferrum sp.]|nr:amylo-alpha-1,6-glucosidase [Candidatus Acidoferrum sp.]